MRLRYKSIWAQGGAATDFQVHLAGTRKKNAIPVSTGMLFMTLASTLHRKQVRTHEILESCLGVILFDTQESRVLYHGSSGETTGAPALDSHKRREKREESMIFRHAPFSSRR
jgi:hypothetical protein